MAKMYYSESEAAGKLGISSDELLTMVREGKVRAYADGANKMFKVAEIDQLAPEQPEPTTQAAAESDIQLSPVEMSGTHAPISLTDTDETPGTGEDSSKGDTVITSEGISIFDDEEIEMEPADPMAKTQIAPGMGEGIGLEGLGSGSGLLDLTRESDDTSLGAEVLDHIDMESGEAPSPNTESVAEHIMQEVEETAPATETPMVVTQTSDPMAGLFSGLAGAGMVLCLLLGLLSTSAVTGRSPGYVQTLAGKLLIVIGAAVVVVIIGAVVGHIMGRSPKAPAAEQS